MYVLPSTDYFIIFNWISQTFVLLSRQQLHLSFIVLSCFIQLTTICYYSLSFLWKYTTHVVFKKKNKLWNNWKFGNSCIIIICIRNQKINERTAAVSLNTFTPAYAFLNIHIFMCRYGEGICQMAYVFKCIAYFKNIYILIVN